MRTPGLSDPSGSCLRVMSHGIKSVISRDIYSGLYLGWVSFDVSHSDTLMLAFFDGITRRAVAVDLHFFPGSYNGLLRGLLLQMLRVLFQHPLVDVYGHVVLLVKPCNFCISGLLFIYSITRRAS